MDATTAVIVLAAGIGLGALLTYSFLSSSLKMRLEAELQEQLRKAEDRAADQAVKRSGATLKGQIGERFAPFVPGFCYEPADARFLGSPVDYVVFEGLSEGQIKTLAFVEVKTGALPLTPFQKQVSEAIKDGRIDFRVVELPE